MSEIAGTAAERARTPRWLRALYAVVLLSALSLATLLVGEVVYAFESEEHEHSRHEHGFYGAIFDAAWVVFLPTVLFSLVAGLAALVGGALARAAAVTRFGAWALGYCALAVLTVVMAESLG
jgi:hypothetical protein